MTSHPERVEEIQPVCVWCDHVLACHHCGTEQPYDDVSVLKSAITASEKRAEELKSDATALIASYAERAETAEKRASEAERTFADLRTGMQKIVAENAQFARRINELERALSLSEADIAGGHHRESKLVRERNAAREALSALGYPFLPCPICKGVEGCDHTVPESATHRVTEAVRERDEARTQTGVWIARATKTVSERDEAVRRAEEAERERDAWIETARQHCNNELFYHGLVIEIGERFGVEAKTSDDGSVQQDVLALKVPELSAKVISELTEARAALGKVVEALKMARTYVELSYDETDGEEACEAKHALSVIDTALISYGDS